MKPLRIVTVGHYAYFSNHFPEGWAKDDNVLCLDVTEKDYSFLIAAANFKPDIAVFYRPELYPEHYLKMISGKRIAFLSEPIPELRDGKILGSSETQLRIDVYRGMKWHVFDRIFYYDKSKAEMVDALGWPITDYRPLPVDTSVFKPRNGQRPIDICFIGKPTPHRIWQLDFLRSMNVRFVWVAHGVSGAALAKLFRQSKVVINIHADGLRALEPRIWLAAACGCAVLSEPTPSEPMLANHIVTFDGKLNEQHVEDSIKKFHNLSLNSNIIDPSYLSFRQFLVECCSDPKPDRS